MTTDFYSYDMLTGRRITPLPVSKGSWTITIGADPKMSCSIPAQSAVAAKLKIWDHTTLASSGLLVVVDGVPVAAGPIWKRRYTQGKDIDLTAGGLRSYWERRLLLPVAARDNPLIDEEGDPVTAYDFAASNLSPGTIAKRYLELIELWPGGAVPLALPADEVGTTSDTVKAIDLKKVRTLIDNLSQRTGTDFDFRPRWDEDGLGIYHEMLTGTVANPRLGNTDPDLVKWTVGATRGGAFNFVTDEDGTKLAEEVFFSGGSGADKVVMAHARNAALADRGFPLLQVADTGHSDVTEQETADEYATEAARRGQYPASFWSMSVRANERGTPKLGDFWIGDMSTITIDRREPVLPAGDFERRIVEISGDASGHAYDLTFAEATA